MGLGAVSGVQSKRPETSTSWLIAPSGIMDRCRETPTGLPPFRTCNLVRRVLGSAELNADYDLDGYRVPLRDPRLRAVYSKTHSVDKQSTPESRILLSEDPEILDTHCSSRYASIQAWNRGTVVQYLCLQSMTPASLRCKTCP